MGSYWSSPQVLPKRGSGPHQVGCADLMVDGSVIGGEGIFMRVYFPTDAESSSLSDHPEWLPRRQYAHGLGQYIGRSPRSMDFFLATIVGKKVSDCIENAPLSKSKAQWPVVVFSHGLSGSRTYYSTYCTSLASHGYVVAAVEHWDQSACWTYQLTEEEGELVEKPLKMIMIAGHDENEYEIRKQQVEQRVIECEKVYTILELLNSGASLGNVLLGREYDWAQFKDKLDMSTAAIIGHSFGGATAVASSGENSKFKKAVAFDGWMFSLDETKQERATLPTLFIIVGDWQWTENVDVIKKLSKNHADNLILTLSGAVHQCFSDFPFIFPYHFIAKQFGVQGPTDSALCIEAAVELSVKYLVEGKEGTQKLKDDKFANFMSNEVYARKHYT